MDRKTAGRAEDGGVVSGSSRKAVGAYGDKIRDITDCGECMSGSVAIRGFNYTSPFILVVGSMHPYGFSTTDH